MPRVRILHWKPEEAAPLVDAVRKAGFEPEYGGETSGPPISRAIRANPPAAVLIDLSRLPSHGREMAVWMRNTKSTRHIPIVFVNGEAEKVERVKELIPDAGFATTNKLGPALRKACKGGPANPVAPPEMMARYKDKPISLKLGMTPGSVAAVINAPRDYRAIIGELPEGAQLVEEPEGLEAITVWFIYSVEDLLAALPRMRSIASKTKLWVARPKGQNRPPENSIRQIAIDGGLVDYKICALGPHWSGILFARKKS
jgi:CheY-like chemotaxis protein